MLTDPDHPVSAMPLSRKKPMDTKPWEIRKRQRFMLPLERIDPAVRTIRQRRGTVNLPTSWQGDIQFSYVLAGTGFIEKEGRRHELAPGSMLFFMPYQRYTFICEDPAFEIVIALFDIAPGVPGASIQERMKNRNAWAYDILFPRGMTLPLHLTFQPGGLVETLSRDMVHAYTQDNLLGRYRAKVLLHRLLLLALEHQTRDVNDPHAGMTPAQSRIEATLAHIIRHAASPLSIPELASHAELSVSHFIRTFKQWTGQTPADYIHHQRVEEAKRLLADARLSVKQIARQVGYQDPFHFSRVFRRVAGQSPSTYRQAMIMRTEDIAKSS